MNKQSKMRDYFNTNKRDSATGLAKNLSKTKIFSIGGIITNQFDYGAIPYYMAGNTFPASLFKSNGLINIRLSKIPLIAEYYYSNPSYISGLNNYFTIRLDVNELQNLKKKDHLEKVRPLKSKLDSLNFENQKAKQQLALLENQKFKTISSPDKLELPIVSTPTLTDSIKISTPDTSFIKPPSNSIDSLKNIYSSLDTSLRKINELNENISQTEKAISELKQKISVIENPQPGISPDLFYPQNKFLKFMGGFKRLEVGMCYPSYSTFMINQMAIKGINLNYAFDKAFVNLSAGKTIVNYSITPTTNSVLNQIQQLTSLVDWSKNWTFRTNRPLSIAAN